MKDLFLNTPKALWHSRLFRWVFFSGFSYVLNIGLTATFHELLGLPEEISYAFTIMILLIINFFTIRNYVFESLKENPKTQAVRFVFAVFAFRVVEYLTFLFLLRALGIYYLVSITITLIFFFILKYFFFKKIVFPSKLETF